VRQLLTQAEVHGAQLTIDEGELENQKAINDMKLYEEEKNKNPELKPALMPLSRANSKPILQQLNELQDDNKALKGQVESLQRQLAMSQEAAARGAGGAMGGGPPPMPGMAPPLMPGMGAPGAPPPMMAPAGGLPAIGGGASGALPTLPSGAATPGGLLAPAAMMQPANATGGAAAGAVGGDASGEAAAKLQEKLKAKDKELREVKKELTQKVGQTAQYQNLRKMMAKKTEELKKFKSEMEKYDKSFGKEDDVEEEEDDE